MEERNDNTILSKVILEQDLCSSYTLDMPDGLNT